MDGHLGANISVEWFHDCLLYQFQWRDFASSWTDYIKFS